MTDPALQPAAGMGAPIQSVLVVGASRGLGLEFVRQYRAAGAAVTGTARDDAGLQRLRDLGAAAVRLDVAAESGSHALAWPLDGARFDAVIVNAGQYGPRSSALQPPTADEFDAVMRTNVLGPMRVIAQLDGALAPGARLVAISSKMGSIGLRSATAGWLYRASKAALNSVWRDVSLVHAGQATCVVMHPGWVRTDMGGSGADLAIDDAVARMRATIARLRAADNGSFLDLDGQPLAW